MTPEQLKTEILSGPMAAACAPFVLTPAMPKAAGRTAAENDQVIADILNGYLTEKHNRKIGIADLLGALGLTLGAAVYEKLQLVAAVSVPVKLALGLLERDNLDIGHDETQAAIDALPAPFTPEEKAAMKQLAWQPTHISGADVSIALRGT